MIELNNTTQVRVRYAETDKMGVVYNANYFVYFEVGRNEIMRQYNIHLSDYEQNDKVYFPLFDAYARYIMPAGYDDLLTIETKFIYNDSLKMTFESTIKRGETLICKGYTNHCFVSQTTMKPVKPPATFLEQIISQNNIK
ncbi:MAG: acyl-CoA thioesterase [Ignavibacteria bacterium]|jgi:acyl-CoA thioester hydrolase|nr:acyl-CoA thioesterase [Ignavibacteria bacterium]